MALIKVSYYIDDTLIVAPSQATQSARRVINLLVFLGFTINSGKSCRQPTWENLFAYVLIRFAQTNVKHFTLNSRNTNK